ncbi:MAG: co-chaperone GroES [Vicinamibacterales bacterium]
MMTTWEPKYDQLLVRPLTPANMSRMGIVLPDPEGRERPQFGVVLAVGPGLRAELTGTLVTCATAVGDLVAFGKYAGAEMALETDHPPVLVMRDLEAILRKPAGTYTLVEHEGGKYVHEAAYLCEYCPRESSALIAEERARLVAARAAED